MRTGLGCGRKMWVRMALGVFLFLARGAQGQEEDGWRTATPEEVGVDSAALVEMFDFIAERKIPVHSVQVARKGRLALDSYIYPFSAETRHDVASVTKSVTSTLVGLGIERGRIRGVKEPVVGFFKGQKLVEE